MGKDYPWNADEEPNNVHNFEKTIRETLMGTSTTIPQDWCVRWRFFWIHSMIHFVAGPQMMDHQKKLGRAPIGSDMLDSVN